MYPSNENITPHEEQGYSHLSSNIDQSPQFCSSGPSNRNAASKASKASKASGASGASEPCRPSQPSQASAYDVPIVHWVKTDVPVYGPPQTFQSADNYQQGLRDGTLNEADASGPPLFTVRKWTRPSHLPPLQEKYLGRLPDVRRRPDGTYYLADHMLKKGFGGEKSGAAAVTGGPGAAGAVRGVGAAGAAGGTESVEAAQPTAPNSNRKPQPKKKSIKGNKPAKKAQVAGGMQ